MLPAGGVQFPFISCPGGQKLEVCGSEPLAPDVPLAPLEGVLLMLDEDAPVEPDVPELLDVPFNVSRLVDEVGAPGVPEAPPLGMEGVLAEEGLVALRGAPPVIEPEAEPLKSEAAIAVTAIVRAAQVKINFFIGTPYSTKGIGKLLAHPRAM